MEDQRRRDGVIQKKIDYFPRKWAQRMHDSTKRWCVAVLHRRAGKTTAILNHHQRAALDDQWEKRRLKALMPELTEKELASVIKNRFYGHVMPTRVQAKMVAWDMLKGYAKGTGAVPNESELLLRYPNGSRIQLFGADDPDKMRGAGFSGLSLEPGRSPPAIINSAIL